MQRGKHYRSYSILLISLLLLISSAGGRLCAAERLLGKADTTQLGTAQADSTAQAGASALADSAALADSTAVADSAAVADSTALLTGRELKRYEREKRAAARMAEKSRKLAIKDSIFNYRDSVIRHTPRVLTSNIFPKEVKYQRIFSWQTDTRFNNYKVVPIDSSFNQYYTENPLYKNDVGGVSLGVEGTASEYFNFFKREELPLFPFMKWNLPYTYTPSTMPFYNTKTPYTELAYWGTLFADRQKEETNIKFLHTQNLSPSLNISILYQRFGGAGMLQNEKSDDRTLALTFNYIGDRYLAQGGYIYNKVERKENGGISDLFMYKDTIVDVRTIPVYLSDASSIMKRSTFFLSHSLGVPLNFLRKRDSLDFGEGTMVWFGHYGEYTTYSRHYYDAISLSDTQARELYHNNFFINPTQSNETYKVESFDNRLFVRLQPWAPDAIVSQINAGIGYQMVGYLTFRPEFYISGNKYRHQNNPYLHFGASGLFRKYFKWDAIAKYNIGGYYSNDFELDANIRFSLYPIEEGVHLAGRLFVSSITSNPFFYSYFSNHYKWENDFAKETQTRVEAKLSIPRWKLEGFFGYAMLKDRVYMDQSAQPQQNGDAVNVVTAYVQKNFRLWRLHFNNRILFQNSSNQEILPLPKFAVNLRYFLEFDVVKNVMKAQLGADLTLHSKYYMPGYDPALGMFYNQREMEVGGRPYLDLFLNLQWKRACIFVKGGNIGQNSLSKEYFSAYRYTRPQTHLKFGLFWPFYIK